MKRADSHRRHDGFAMITAFWLMLVGVMLVTTMASVLQGAISLSSSEAAVVRARMSATSAIMKVVADLIQDRPSGSTDTPGLVLTEVMNNPYLGATLSINGIYVNGLSDQISIYNWGTKSMSLGNLKVRGYDIDGSSWVATETTLSAVVLAPGQARWFTYNCVQNSGNFLVYLYQSDGTTQIDSVTLAVTTSPEKWACLPDGANSGGSSAGQNVNAQSLNPNNGKVYRWVRAPALNLSAGSAIVPSGAPGTTTETYGAGVWMDSYTLEKHVGTAVTTYSFPSGKIFLRHGKSFVVKNDTTGWTLGTSGETQIPLTLASGIPWMDHSAMSADSTAFILKGPSGIVSQSRKLIANTANQRWRRESTTDPNDTMTVLAGPGTPGTPELSYSITTHPFISEVNDPSAGSSCTYPMISKIAAQVSSSATADREAVEIFNASGIAWNLAVTPLKLVFQAGSVGNVVLNSGTIPAYGFALWTDSAGLSKTTITDSDFYTSTISWNTINTNTQVGLYNNATGECYDTGFAPAGNGDASERKANAGSSNATMAVGGADQAKGNGYDVLNTSGDFVSHATCAGATVQWKNRSSAVETPISNPYDANEFVEITLGPPPATAGSATEGDRRYEFIEIQNSSGSTVDIEGDEWWVSVGSTTGANKRFLYALYGGASTLADGKVGVIVAVDADTQYIANLHTLSPGSIQWFGTGAQASTPTDTMLGDNRNKPIGDTSFCIVLGFGTGGVPATMPYWYGLTLPDADSGAVSTETSWQKLFLINKDSYTSPFTAYDRNNWKQNPPTPGEGLSTAGRFGYDGPGDTWYPYNYDTFVKLYTASGLDIYYRIRVFDEGAKINANWVARAASSDSLLYNTMSTMLKIDPNPPWPGINYLSATDADSLVDDLRQNWDDSPLVTPVSLYLMYMAVGHHLMPPFFPYLTIYGYNEPGVFPININMAESVVLAGCFQQMLASADKDSFYPTIGFSTAQARARNVANIVYKYMTDIDGNGDTVAADDTGFRTVTAAYDKVRNLMTDVLDTNALNSAGVTEFAKFFNVNSTNYFMLYSTGFAFRQNANLATDTPIATYRIVSVVRRESSMDKAKFLYWRENFEFSDTTQIIFTMPIGTRRYPRARWDVSYN